MFNYRCVISVFHPQKPMKLGLTIPRLMGLRMLLMVTFLLGGNLLQSLEEGSTTGWIWKLIFSRISKLHMWWSPWRTPPAQVSGLSKNPWTMETHGPPGNTLPQMMQNVKSSFVLTFYCKKVCTCKSYKFSA